MEITGREACRRLEEVGHGRSQARRVLDAGLAGPARTTSWATWFDEDAVAELVARPLAQDDLVDRACPDGVLILRRWFRADLPWEDRAAALAPAWRFSPWTRVELQIAIGKRSSVPVVATIGGFVAAGCDLVSVRSDSTSSYVLGLVAPGAWFGPLEDTRLEAGPGTAWIYRGRQWRATGSAWMPRHLSPRHPW